MRASRAALLVATAVTLCAAPAAQALSVHVEHEPHIRANVHLHFTAPALPKGGYYYAVVVLRRYQHHTRASPPSCSTSSDMQRTDYGYPQSNGVVTLALTPAKSATHHWCSVGFYEGAIYAVPHAPPCEKRYPCRSEPYEPPSPCWGTGGHIVCGVVAQPALWRYPDPLPAPLASGTTIRGRFSLTFAKK